MLSAFNVVSDEIDNAIIQSFKLYKIIRIRFITCIYILFISVRVYLDVNAFITIFFENFNEAKSENVYLSSRIVQLYLCFYPIDKLYTLWCVEFKRRGPLAGSC